MEQQAVRRSEGAVSRWVTFTLEDESYGIDVMQVREVLRSPEISPVPGAPSYVLGIINLRGTVVAIIDTRSRFGLPFKEPDDLSRILILDTGEYAIGFLVDSVREVAEVRASEVETPPDTGSRGVSRYIAGLFNRKEGLLILVDAARLLSDEELAELAEL